MTFKKHTRNTFKRLLKYAESTGIKFDGHSATTTGKSSCIPDVRGFSPHRRVVHLGRYKKNDLWIAHDILHILFYDYATQYVPAKEWKSWERFFEIHLASEAFAVLALDYHLLSREPTGGLAVDLKNGSWEKFKKTNPELPTFYLKIFAQTLTDLYFKGETGALAPPKKVPIDSEYSKWLGHEVRYSQKQRQYTRLWWDDLNQNTASKRVYVLENSGAHYAIWELIHLLLYTNLNDWQAWVKKMKSTPNVFRNYAKFKKKKLNLRKLDFRFTRFTAASKNQVQTILEKATTPNASDLFLFWQCLKPWEDVLTKSEKKTVATLTNLAMNKTKIDQKTWNQARAVVVKYHGKFRYTPDPSGVGDFFLL